MDANRVEEITSMMPSLPRGIGPVCADRPAWEEASVQARLQPVVAHAARVVLLPFPAWSDDAYLEYSREGIRVNGDSMLKARHARLTSLVLAECAQGKGHYLPYIAAVLDELISQPSWVSPAHDADFRNLRKNYDVDLFSAALLQDLAQSLYMLGSWVGTDQRKRALEVMEARGFSPVRRSLIDGKSNPWLRRNTNWNPVCLNGVVSAALAVIDSSEERGMFAAAGEHYSKYYRSGFGSDGYAVEGPGYWGYGFSNYSALREILWTATKGQVELMADPKMQQVALYGQRIQMGLGNIAPFGDGTSPRMKMDAFTLAYTNDAYGLGFTEHTAALPINANGGPLMNTLMLLFVKPALTPWHGTATAGVGLQTYFEQFGVFVTRADPAGSSRLAATIKTGGNASHSHNDVGSYAIALGSKQPTGDVGGVKYSKKTFDFNRYTIRAINSYGHPVPVVAGELQRDARSVRAKVLDVQVSDQRDQITIDMTPAYSVAELNSLTRTLTHQRSGTASIEIEDKFDFNSAQSFEVALTTIGAWKQEEDGSITLTDDVENLRAHIEASGPWHLTGENINEEGLSFNRIAIKLDSPVVTGFVRVRFGPGNGS